MIKNFDKWNNLKKDIEKISRTLIIKEWDIWWTNLWINIQTEACWKWDSFKRPILIIKKLSKNTCIAIPLSSKIKSWTWFSTYEIKWIKYSALLYQIKMMHTNRFSFKFWEINKKHLNKIKKDLKYLLNL